MKKRILITKSDLESLRHLIDGRCASTMAGDEYSLEEELDRADVVDAEAIPGDVVTMNSEVRLRDLDSGDEKVHRLVFPSHARLPGSVSILAPVGTALLGYRAGDVVEWRVPKGIRRLEILEVKNQLKAAAIYAD